MKILVFSWRDPKHPLAGGAEQVMHEHMKGWIEVGHKVTLFAAYFKGGKKEEEIDGVNIIREGSPYLVVQFKGFLFYQKHKNEFDLVVDQFHALPFFTPLYIRKAKIAVIQETAREVWFLSHIIWPLNWIVGLIGYLLEPFFFLFYKNIPFITGSQSTKDDIIHFGIPKKNITVIPHGVIIKEVNPLPSKEKKFTVVYLGILSKDKGIEDAIKVFSILNNLGNFQFWVIGKGEVSQYETYIKQVAKKLGLENITFWGYVSQENKFKLLAKAQVLVNPSRREGWGLVNIEANYFGTPVVAYSARGLVDSVRDGVSGVLCKNNTPEDMAKNVLQISVDKDLYSSLQKGSKKWSKNFSWDRSKKKSLELLNNLK